MKLFFVCGHSVPICIRCILEHSSMAKIVRTKHLAVSDIREGRFMYAAAVMRSAAAGTLQSWIPDLRVVSHGDLAQLFCQSAARFRN